MKMKKTRDNLFSQVRKNNVKMSTRGNLRFNAIPVKHELPYLHSLWGKNHKIYIAA